MKERNPSTSPFAEQSILKDANIDGNLSIGSVNQMFNNIQPSLPPLLTSTPENLPLLGTDNFVGRGEAVLWVHQKLQSGRVTALSGMGGVGKTELAIQYARDQMGYYPAGVGWFSARAAAVGVQILKFAASFGLVPPDDPDLTVRVRYIWQHWPVRPASLAEVPEPGDVLLVLDDVSNYDDKSNKKVEPVEPYLPLGSPRFRVLLTTHTQLNGPVAVLSLEVLPPGDALELLGAIEKGGRVDRQPQEAEELCQWLGYLPLGIELVGRYLASKPDLTLAEMLQRLANKGLSAPALEKAQWEGMTANLGVRPAFELSWQELDAQGRELACLVGLFGPAPMPWRLVQSCLPGWDTEKLEDVRDEQLRKLSLLERSSKGIYQLHPLIREYFGEKLEEFAEREALKRGYCGAMVAEAKGFPATPTRDKWVEFASVVPHLAEAASDKLLEYVDNTDLTWPFVSLGRFYEGQGAYAQAEPWYRQCLEACILRFGEEHRDVATSLNNLALLYYSQGRYKEAEPLYIKALEMRKRLLGEEHSDVANSLNNLALLYTSQGRYKEAEPLYVQALDMRKRLLGEKHRDVATSLNNLAILYSFQSRYDEAESLYIQAIKALELLKNSHPNVVSFLNNLADLYRSQDRYDEAEPLYIQALEMCNNLFGEEHPNVASLNNNLALLYTSQGRYDKAEPFYVQALKILVHTLGQEHPSTAKIRQNYLNFLSAVIEQPDVLEKLLSSGSEMTRQVLAQMRTASP